MRHFWWFLNTVMCVNGIKNLAICLSRHWKNLQRSFKETTRDGSEGIIWFFFLQNSWSMTGFMFCRGRPSFARNQRCAIFGTSPEWDICGPVRGVPPIIRGPATRESQTADPMICIDDPNRQNKWIIEARERMSVIIILLHFENFVNSSSIIFEESSSLVLSQPAHLPMSNLIQSIFIVLK